MELPICISKEYWMNSQLSTARYFGGFTSGVNTWLLMPQSFDMVRIDFVKYYRILGRDKFIAVLKEHPQATDNELTDIYKKELKPIKKEQEQTIKFE